MSLHRDYDRDYGRQARDFSEYDKGKEVSMMLSYDVITKISSSAVHGTLGFLTAIRVAPRSDVFGYPFSGTFHFLKHV